MMPADRKRPVTRAYLERAALFYLERYSSSAENLRRVLLRKVRRRLDPGETVGADLVALVDEILEIVQRTGLVEDSSYAESKLSSLARRGISTRLIRSRLMAKGVPEPVIVAAFEANQPDDLALARRYAQRRGLGPWRRAPGPDARARDLATLCRAGFSYGVARAAIDETDA